MCHFELKTKKFFAENYEWKIFVVSTFVNAIDHSKANVGLHWIEQPLLLFHNSLFYMKITGSVKESSHEDRGPCYLHIQIFFLYIHCPLLDKKLF